MCIAPSNTRPATLIATLLALGFASGCGAWRARHAPVSDVLRLEEPNRVRVICATGGPTVVQWPRIVGDQLVGFRPGCPADTASAFADSTSPCRFAVPVREVTRLELYEISATKTTIVVLAGITAIAVIAAIAAQDDDAPAQTSSSNTSDFVISCPVVSSWDGHAWRLDSGTFGGAIAPAFARTDVDNLDHPVVERGRVRLKVESLVAETEHLDALELLVVEHPPGATVVPDPRGELHWIEEPHPPVTVLGDAGSSELDRVIAADGWAWESTPVLRDTTDVAALRDGLVLQFVRPHGRTEASLVVDACNTPWASYLMTRYVAAHGDQTQAWYDRLSHDPELARDEGQALARETFLAVRVWTSEGWEEQGLLWEAGPEAMKRQVAALDLSRVRGDTVRVRLESIPSFWLVDRVAIDFTPPRPAVVRAYAPEWAQDARGVDIASRIRAADAVEYTMERGDAAELSYPVGENTPGLARTFLLRSTGWYQIHADALAPPQTALLERLRQQHGALARAAVSRMNQALVAAGR